MTPTFSLGCGTWGGSVTTDNINYRNLLNVKTVSRRRRPPSGSGCPRTRTSTPARSTASASCEPSQAMLVTDPDAEARGVADEVRAHLDDIGVHVFSEIEPEPNEAQIRAGVKVLDELRPDLLIASAAAR